LYIYDLPTSDSQKISRRTARSLLPQRYFEVRGSWPKQGSRRHPSAVGSWRHRRPKDRCPSTRLFSRHRSSMCLLMKRRYIGYRSEMKLTSPLLVCPCHKGWCTTRVWPSRTRPSASREPRRRSRRLNTLAGLPRFDGTNISPSFQSGLESGLTGWRGGAEVLLQLVGVDSARALGELELVDGRHGVLPAAGATRVALQVFGTGGRSGLSYWNSLHFPAQKRLPAEPAYIRLEPGQLARRRRAVLNSVNCATTHSRSHLNSLLMADPPSGLVGSSGFFEPHPKT